MQTELQTTPRADAFADDMVFRLSADGQDGIGGQKDIVLSNRNVVFVVDDDPGTLKGIKRLLRQHGYDSVLFSSAEAFRDHDDFEQAVCVVLDINLNGQSGIELGHRLKVTGISLPVIYITASDSNATRRAAMGSGCLAYLTKPFSAKSLMASIEKASAATA